MDKRNQYPSVLFIDPFGYKGIKTEVLAKFLENWGNEVFIFVNTKRIQAALENDKFEGLMRDLFPKSFEKVRVEISGSAPSGKGIDTVPQTTVPA